jgi:manganese transport protein
MLVWVIVTANLMAMLIQYLSAKLGIVTDRDLPENFREHYPRPLSWFMWVQAELISMSTDIAEFLGAALGLNLLFGVPLFPAGVMTGFIAFALLGLQRHGYRRFELAITGLLGLLFLGFLYETFKIGPSTSATIEGLVPHLSGTESLYLAVGIIGATVMPHAIYLHSALTNRQAGRARRRSAHPDSSGSTSSLGLAGLINLSMLVIAAELFHVRGLNIETIQGAHSGFSHLAGGFAALTFAVALLVSGVSSSSVGTYAGQVVMAGFVNLRIPLAVRRLVTMAPALIILAIGVSPTSALVLSQVVLSFGIPFALIPLVMLTSRRDVMGVHVNSRLTSTLAWGMALLISGLNVFLLTQTFGV